MNYTLHQLQIFYVVTQTNSITKAAEKLHLTQPAVSIQLKNFQDQFEIPVTEVIGRKVFITDFGKEIALSAEKILNEVSAINFKTMAYKGQLIGRLKISVVSSGKYVMPYFLSDFIQQHQGVELVLDVTNKSAVVESLERNEVDFSLVSVLPDNIQVDDISLMENKLFLASGKKQKLEQKYYDKEILQDVPLIYREAGSGTRQVMELFIKQNNLVVQKKMELTSNEAVKQAVIAGLGYSILPIIGIKNELTNGDIHLIPVREFPIKSTWRMIWMKGKKFSPVAAAFLDYIKKEKEAIIKDKFSWYEQY